MQQYVFWLVILSVLSLILFSAINIIGPFVISFVISYFLSSNVDYLEAKCNINRAFASGLVVLIFFTIIISSLSFLIPEFIEQSRVIISELPKYQKYLNNELLPSATEGLSKIDPRFANSFLDIMQNVSSFLISYVGNGFNHALDYTLSTISMIFTIFLLPIIMFYLLLDWHLLFIKIVDIIPLKYKNTFIAICDDINDVMRGYVRGQFYISTCVSIYYTIGFLSIDLPAPVVLGIICGFAIIIPLVGAFFSFSLIMLIGYVSFGISINLIYIIVLFSISQIVEGSFITPKVLGDKVGIHPVMIIFMALLFGNLFGLMGAFFAIPLSAIIKILISHMMRSYKKSIFYNNLISEDESS